MKKLKHVEVKKFAQVHIADEGQSQGSISGRSDSELREKVWDREIHCGASWQMVSWKWMTQPKESV